MKIKIKYGNKHILETRIFQDVTTIKDEHGVYKLWYRHLGEVKMYQADKRLVDRIWFLK